MLPGVRLAVHTHLWSSGSVACTVPVIQSVYPRRRTRALQTFKCPYLQSRVDCALHYRASKQTPPSPRFVFPRTFRCPQTGRLFYLDGTASNWFCYRRAPSVCVQHRWHWTSAYIPPGGRLTNRAKSAAKFRRNWGYVGCTCSCTAPCRAFSAGSQRRRLKDI